MLAILVLLLLLILLIVITVYFCYELVLGSLHAPFVPSSGREVDRVLEMAKLKRGMKLVDLGSGDGRVVLKAARNYGVNGVGVERNPFLVMYSRIRASIWKVKSAKYERRDLYSYPLSGVDIVYLFLMPKMLKKLAGKLDKECKKGTLVIARGFKVPGLKPYQQVDGKYFDTYFYKL